MDGFAIDRVKRPSISETAIGSETTTRIVLDPTNKWCEKQVQGRKKESTETHNLPI